MIATTTTETASITPISTSVDKNTTKTDSTASTNSFSLLLALSGVVILIVNRKNNKK
jgi:hypothetical protein